MRPLPKWLHTWQLDDIRKMYQSYGIVNMLGVGSGKTVETLSTLQLWIDAGVIDCAVITCKKSSLRITWKAEIDASMPHLDSVYLSGDDDPRKRRKLWQQEHELYVINHDLISNRLDKVMIGVLMENRRTALVCDELQVIRNHTTAMYGNWCDLREKSHRCIGLTATPLHKSPADLYSMMCAIGARMGSLARYLDEYCTVQKMIVRNPNAFAGFSTIVTPTGFKPGALDRLKKFLQPRTVYRPPDLIKLPALRTKDYEVVLNVHERAAYDAIEESKTFPNRHVGMGSVPAEGGFNEVAVREWVDANLGQHSRIRAVLSGKVKSTMRPAKDQLLLEELPQWVADGGKVIVFSPYSETTIRLQKMLQTELKPLSFVTLIGSMTLKQREESINAMRGDLQTVCLLMTMAGAESLNLQDAANHVCLFDRLYVPADEDQVLGRVYRQGQQKDCVLHRFIVRDTVDESISMVLDRRRRMLNTIKQMALPEEVK